MKGVVTAESSYVLSKVEIKKRGNNIPPIPILPSLFYMYRILLILIPMP